MLELLCLKSFDIVIILSIIVLFLFLISPYVDIIDNIIDYVMIYFPIFLCVYSIYVSYYLYGFNLSCDNNCKFNYYLFCI